MPPSSPASFLNLDLEIDASFDLSALADFMAQRAFVLYCGPTESGFRLAVEPLVVGSPATDPFACTERFIDLVRSLPDDLARQWHACTSRVFDYGFDGGIENPPLQTTLPSDLLVRIAGLRADVRITVYPFRERTDDHSPR